MDARFKFSVFRTDARARAFVGCSLSPTHVHTWLALAILTMFTFSSDTFERESAIHITGLGLRWCLTEETGVCKVWVAGSYIVVTQLLGTFKEEHYLLHMRINDIAAPVGFHRRNHISCAQLRIILYRPPETLHIRYAISCRCYQQHRSYDAKLRHIDVPSRYPDAAF